MVTAVGVAGLGAAVLLWRLTHAGALALAGAGIGFVVVALVRIDCPNGAARCGLGGRFDVHGAPAITHWTAAVVSAVLVLVGTALVAYALYRSGRRRAALASAIAAAATLVQGARLRHDLVGIEILPGLHHRFAPCDVF